MASDIVSFLNAALKTPPRLAARQQRQQEPCAAAAVPLPAAHGKGGARRRERVTFPDQITFDDNTESDNEEGECGEGGGSVGRAALLTRPRTAPAGSEQLSQAGELGKFNAHIDDVRASVLSLARGPAGRAREADGGLSPARPARTTKRHRHALARSQSAIDPQHIETATSKLAQKRARNRTMAVTPAALAAAAEEPGEGGQEPAAPDRSREAEMRKEIMMLQKQHIIELQKERSILKDENAVLLGELAAREEEHGRLKLECETLKSRHSERIEDYHEDVSVLQSERDIAIEKLAQLTRIMQQLVEEEPTPGLRREVHHALGLETTAQREMAFDRIAQGLRWEDMDEAVHRANAELDRSLSLESASHRLASRATSDGSDPEQHLRALQASLAPRLRGLLHASNDMRIRSAALCDADAGPGHWSAPTTPVRPAADAPAFVTPPPAARRGGSTRLNRARSLGSAVELCGDPLTSPLEQPRARKEGAEGAQGARPSSASGQRGNQQQRGARRKPGRKTGKQPWS